MCNYIIELKNVSRFFGSVIALKDINMKLSFGECHCLLGDNGAGKSTLIKILAGVYRPSGGQVLIDGKPTKFASPKDSLDIGIATVYQDLALVPLMSVTRNFFMGREIEKGWGPFKFFDLEQANQITIEGLAEMGIVVRDANQAIGTMSGGERQSLAIARAIYFGARVLILDEPTAALGVKQSAKVLKVIAQARAKGLAIVLITHNLHHAFPVGDRFTLLKRGCNLGSFRKKEITREKLLKMMAGGAELDTLEAELNEFKYTDATAAGETKGSGVKF